MNNRKINITELEFDTIKQNLKLFLSGQPEFSDYDFEGSNMSILLDVLAYNTHYNAMYINMALNEIYLDSAAKRESVVSIAKGIGYTPMSARCARGVISFELVNTSTTPDFAILPKFSVFRSQINGSNYNFYTTENHVIPRSPLGTYIFNNINVLEGAPVKNTYTHSAENRYRLANRLIDLSTLTVKVQETTTSSNFVTYQNGNQFVGLDGNSLVYFIKEMDSGLYELSFGDNIIGRRLVPGNLITVEYMVASGAAPNGIRTLSYSGTTILGGRIVNITMQSPIHGGQDQEDIESIRSNAPNFWLSQNRAVTEADYRSIILSKYPTIQDVKVWGGDKNEPPVYGKVFIAATTTENLPLSETQKKELTDNILDKFKVVSVIPTIVDPEYIDVELDVAVYYNQLSTNKTGSDIKTAAIFAIDQYNTLRLRNFDSQLRHSELINAIEQSDNSVTNVIPKLRLYKKIEPFYLVNHNYTINIGNPIAQQPASIITNAFRYAGSTQPMYIDNNVDGTLNLFYFVDGQKQVVTNIGFVDYNKGIITFNNLKVMSLLQPDWIVKIIPAAHDVIGKASNIVKLDMSKLKVTVLPDQSDTNNYNFTSSR